MSAQRTAADGRPSSQPRLHRHGVEIQTFGDLRLMPIALAHEARLDSAQLLNQIGIVNVTARGPGQPELSRASPSARAPTSTRARSTAWSPKPTATEPPISSCARRWTLATSWTPSPIRSNGAWTSWARTRRHMRRPGPSCSSARLARRCGSRHRYRRCAS